MVATTCGRGGSNVGAVTVEAAMSRRWGKASKC